MRNRKGNWLPGRVDPVRKGVYQRKTKAGITTYSLWTGREWRVGSASVDFAATREDRSIFQSLSWRGSK